MQVLEGFEGQQPGREAIERIHLGEGIGSGRKENTETEETEFEGMPL